MYLQDATLGALTLLPLLCAVSISHLAPAREAFFTSDGLGGFLCTLCCSADK